jgi:hypothetical protein
MKVYLFFLERSQNSISLPYYVFFLILYQSQSAVFCEIVVAETESELTLCCRRGLFWSFGLLSLCDGRNVDSFLPCFRQKDD